MAVTMKMPAGYGMLDKAEKTISQRTRDPTRRATGERERNIISVGGGGEDEIPHVTRSCRSLFPLQDPPSSENRDGQPNLQRAEDVGLTNNLNVTTQTSP